MAKLSIFIWPYTFMVEGGRRDGCCRAELTHETDLTLCGTSRYGMMSGCVSDTVRSPQFSHGVR